MAPRLEASLPVLDTYAELNKALDNAVKTGYDYENDGERDLPTSESYMIIGQSTPEAFKKVIEKYEGHMSLWLQEDGKVAIHELVAGPIHETSHVSWQERMRESLGEHMNTVTFKSTTGHQIGKRFKAPDDQLYPKERYRLSSPTFLPFPTLVLEVDHGCGSLKGLKSLLNLWLSPETDVNIFIGLKIFSYNQNKKGRRMVLLYGERWDTGITKKAYEVGSYCPKGVPGPYPPHLEIPVSLLLDKRDTTEVVLFNLHRWLKEVKESCVMHEGHDC